jgi:hypothetical protein
MFRGNKMKNKILTGLAVTLLSTVFSSTTFAAVKDKKAIRAVDAKIAEEVTNVKTACGNSSLNVTVNWDEYKTMISTNKETLKSEKYKSEWVIGHSGERTVAVLESISKICAADEDYKEELAKLTDIQVLPKASFEDTKSEFSLNGNTLTVKTGHKMTRSFSDFTTRIKDLY